jgi:hypothetical protein
MKPDLTRRSTLCTLFCGQSDLRIYTTQRDEAMYIEQLPEQNSTFALHRNERLQFACEANNFRILIRPVKTLTQHRQSAP